MPTEAKMLKKIKEQVAQAFETKAISSSHYIQAKAFVTKAEKLKGNPGPRPRNWQLHLKN